MRTLTKETCLGLMTYASISSRIGGAIVLAISGVVFGLFG